MLYNVLNINDNELISIIGAGGKTTTMFHLAKEAKKKNMRVLVTTTTAIYYPKEKFIDDVKVLEYGGFSCENIKKPTITVIGETVSKEGKLLGIEPNLVNKIHKKKCFDLIIVEADGAKEKPIKAPADYEPVIPAKTTKVIGVIGLDCIDKRINKDNVHRPDVFCSVTGAKINKRIIEDDIIKLITSSNGLFKGALDNYEKYLLLNKADNELRKNSAKYIAEGVIEKGNCNIKNIIMISFFNEFIEKVI